MNVKEMHVDLGEHINLNDEKRLDDIIDTLKAGEKLVLTLNRADAHQADDLISYLERKGFEIQPKGGHEDEFYLHCWRKKD